MSQALMILGFNTVRNAIITISVIDLVGIQDKLNEFNIKEFWHHAVSVAVIGKYLAAKTRKVTPEDAFVAGLLHDIGKIIMLHNFPDHSLDVLEMMYCDGISFIEAEKKISSVTHAQIGGHLARKWQFSKQQVDAIRLHHSMNLNATDPCLHVIIYLANLIAQNKIHGVLIETDFASRYPDFSKAICQYRDNISEWLPEVTREIEEACGFFIESDN